MTIGQLRRLLKAGAEVLVRLVPVILAIAEAISRRPHRKPPQ
jgi:hypothetical protein